MSTNAKSILIHALGLAGLVVLEIALLSRDRTNEDWIIRKDRQITEMADRLTFTDTSDAFRKGRFENVSLAADEPARIVLDDRRTHGFPRKGDWVSPEVIADFPFTELLPSWNASTPANTGVRFSVRSRDAATRQWSPWLRIGAWGRTTGAGEREEFQFGKVETDTLVLDQPADAYQIRANLQSFDLNPSVNPSIRRIAASYSGRLDPTSAWAKTMNPTSIEGWARDLDVPFLPQGDNAEPVTGLTCSPTSVSMVLDYWGVNRPAMENCLAIYDEQHDMFGNWSNATQRAGELGMDAWLQRFRNWDQVKAMIARGQPVIASIRFEKGTFPDAPIYQATPGHLIVIRGFTPEGNIIVNDPANRAKGHRVVYPAKGLAHAWFGNGGVGYVIHPPSKPIPAALVKGPVRTPATMPATAPVAASSAR